MTPEGEKQLLEVLNLTRTELACIRADLAWFKQREQGRGRRISQMSHDAAAEIRRMQPKIG